jgi:hypothetical protein
VGHVPDNIGHTRSAGCFRCHGGEHASQDGKKITNNCFACHHSSAVGDASPDILGMLGLEKVLSRVRKR